MDITREVMRGWGWSEEAIDWYMEDRRLLAEMSDQEKGYYLGVFDAIAYDNGAHDNGLSRHRLPVYPAIYPTSDGKFNYRKFLCVVGDLDGDGHIFTPGLTRVREDYGEDVVFALHCTESKLHSEPEELTDVTWGYRESLEVWKGVHG